MYVSKSEGANFWLSVLTDLQNRGVKDIMIACIDGLKGFPDAIKSVFPDTAVQLCVIHQIRNSMKYVGSKYQKEFMKNLKPVYGAVIRPIPWKATTARSARSQRTRVSSRTTQPWSNSSIWRIATSAKMDDDCPKLGYYLTAACDKVRR